MDVNFTDILYMSWQALFGRGLSRYANFTYALDLLNHCIILPFQSSWCIHTHIHMHVYLAASNSIYYFGLNILTLSPLCITILFLIPIYTYIQKLLNIIGLYNRFNNNKLITFIILIIKSSVCTYFSDFLDGILCQYLYSFSCSMKKLIVKPQT